MLVKWVTIGASWSNWDLVATIVTIDSAARDTSILKHMVELPPKTSKEVELRGTPDVGAH